ncbi:MAG: hypothetical protein ACLUB1_04105 [Streptococcus lutetiensis]
MNLTERAEIRKETYYKLTNSATAPTVLSTNAQNLLLNSPVNADNLRRFGASKATISVVTRDNRQAYKLTVNTSGDSGAMFNGNSGYYNLIKDRLYTFSFYALTNIDKSYSFNSLGHIQAINEHGDIVGSDKLHQHSNPVYSTNTIKANSWTKVWCTFKATSTSYFKPYFWYLRAGDEIYINNMMLNEGDTPLPYVPAPEDYGWSKDTLVPTQSNRYLWKFEYIYYSDGSVENTQPVNISIAGADGTNGQTSHVHFAFADNATGGGFSLTTPKAYMGWYADFNEAASTDPTKYRWSKWKGDQGLPGKPGADGKTSYFHMAYADSADGRTGFSFKESGQQYQGYYTDFVQANSTDPTKYTWMDRRAGIEVDFRNLLSKTNRGKTNWSWIISSGGTTAEDYNVDGINAVKLTRTSDASFSWNYIQYQGLLRNLIEPNTKYTLSFDIKPSVDVTFTASLRRGDSGAPLTNSTTMNKATANQWNKVSCVLTSKTTLPDDLSQVVYLQGMPVAKGNYLIIKNIKLGKGNVPTPWIPALEDTQDQIDSKADQTLTQEQLNALAEKNNLIKAEMEAKASIDTVDKWITAYENYVKANDADKAKSEQALKEASERILGMRYEVNDLKFAWDAIDRFMSFQNEGLIIGKKDGSAYAKFSDDRISLFSGSSEVMYISQGTLNIANGIFTKTIQIGRFRFETHPADADMLVLRYLGG